MTTVSATPGEGEVIDEGDKGDKEREGGEAEAKSAPRG